MANYIDDLRKLIGSRPIIYTGVTVVILNDNNEILPQRNTTTGEWGTIGGALELGESFGEEAAKRELMEETGLTTHDLKFITLLSGKEFYYKYPNGDEVYYVAAVFETIGVTGQLRGSESEGLELKYFDMEKPIENMATVSRAILTKAGYIN